MGIKFNTRFLHQAFSGIAGFYHDGYEFRRGNLAITAALALAAGGGYYWNSASKSEVRAAQVFATELKPITGNDRSQPLTGMRRNGLSFTLTGPNTVAVSEAGIGYTFNYQTNFVTIDGPDKADTVKTFGELPDSTLKEDALKVGCAIARHQGAATLPVAARQTFIREHC